MKIHFICNGNIFRSIIAEAYLKSLNLPGLQVTSSGAIAAAHREMNRQYQPSVQKVLLAHGVGSLHKTEPDQLTQARTDNQDITICMNAIAYTNSAAIVKLPSNTIVWDVTDIGEGDRIALDGDRAKLSQEVYDEIVLLVDNLVAQKISNK